MELKGKLNEDQTRMTGELIYDGKLFTIDLTRNEKPIRRSQTPKRPFPYLSEDIVFRNKKDSINLAATLTLPDSTGKFPAVVLISGSQPHERRIDALHHNMFLVVSDFLTRNGIAVLHSDSRGTEGLGKKFFQSTAKDIAGDVNAAVEYLMNRKEIDKTKIGLIGHSEGGLVAAITAAENKNISFVVMLAGMAISGKENFKLQHELRYKHGEFSWELFEFLGKLHERVFSLYSSHTDTKIIHDSLMLLVNEYDSIPDIQKASDGIGFSMAVRALASEHYRFIFSCNPKEYISRITCPVLSLNGTHDLRVPAKINQETIRVALTKGGNTNFRIVEMEGLNHDFQECKTGTLKESYELEQTFSPRALKEMLDWIQEVAIK